MPDIGMVIGQFLRLFGDGVDDLGPAIADVDAIKPGKCIQQAVALAVLDIDALAAGHHTVRHLAAGKLRQMGGRVKEILPVPLIQQIIFQHCIPFRFHPRTSPDRRI